MSTDSRLRGRASAGSALSSLGLVTVLLMSDQLLLHLRIASATAVLIAITGLAGCLSLSAQRPYRLGTLYLLLFALFHVGLLVPVALGIPPRLTSGYDARWVQGASFRWAAVAVSISLLCLLVGYFVIIASRGGKRAHHNDLSEAMTNPSPETAAVSLVGLIVLALSVATWFAVVVESDPGLLTGSYAEFLEVTHGTVLPQAYLGMGVGVSLVAAGSNAAMTRVSLAIFVAFALPGFLLGLRGEVIIPSAVWLAVAARRRVIKFRYSSIVILIAALAVGSAIAQVRAFGLAAVPWEKVAVSPMNGLTELGYSIRPLVVVHQWHDVSHEPHVGAGTYAAPFERLVEGRLLGRPTTPASDDERVFGSVVAERVGPIGGSPAAEAYRAGRLTGMVAVMLLIGAITGLLDGMRRSPLRNAFVGCVGFILLLWVRNDFTPVLGQAVFTVLVLYAAWLVEQLLPTRHPRRPGSAETQAVNYAAR